LALDLISSWGFTFESEGTFEGAALLQFSLALENGPKKVVQNLKP